MNLNKGSRSIFSGGIDFMWFIKTSSSENVFLYDEIVFLLRFFCPDKYSVKHFDNIMANSSYLFIEITCFRDEVATTFLQLSQDIRI